MLQDLVHSRVQPCVQLDVRPSWGQRESNPHVFRPRGLGSLRLPFRHVPKWVTRNKSARWELPCGPEYQSGCTRQRAGWCAMVTHPCFGPWTLSQRTESNRPFPGYEPGEATTASPLGKAEQVGRGRVAHQRALPLMVGETGIELAITDFRSVQLGAGDRIRTCPSFQTPAVGEEGFEPSIPKAAGSKPAMYSNSNTRP
jgi:hypothetical protein